MSSRNCWNSGWLPRGPPTSRRAHPSLSDSKVAHASIFRASKRRLAADATRMVLVDTNILAYLMIEGDRTAAVQKLFERDSDWCSEAFAIVEFSNIIATYVRTEVLSQAQG